MQNLAQSNQNFGNSAGKLGDQVKDLSGKMGITLPDGATQALNSLNGFSAGTVAAMGAAAAGVAAMIKVCKKLHEITLQAAADADELITKSMVTGLSTETLQQWEYAQNLIDVSVETMTGSLTKLTRAMYDAQTGNAAAAETFQALGVSITDSSGQLRSAEEVFYEVIDALGGVESQTERDAIAMEIMGRNAQELNPLILQGSDALRELAEEAKDTGYVLDESQIKKLGEVDDAYQRMQLTLDATRNQIAAEFAPASKQAMETFAKAVKLGGDTLEETGIVRNTAALIENILGIVDAGMDMIDALPSWMNPLETVSGAMKGLAVVAATVADSMSLVASLMKLDFHGAATALGWNLQKGEMSHLQQLKYSDPKYVSYNAAGTDNWRGGLTWVGESGPELVSLPRGSQIYSNQESRAMAGVTIGTVVIEARTIRELNDLVRIFQGAQIEGRMS